MMESLFAFHIKKDGNISRKNLDFRVGNGLETFIEWLSSCNDKTYAACKTVLGNGYRLLYEDEYGWDKPEAEYDEDVNSVATKISLGSVIEHNDCYLCKVEEKVYDGDVFSVKIVSFTDEELEKLEDKLAELGGHMEEYKND